MKLKKLAFAIIGIIFMLVILITINVQASNSLKAVMQSSKNELKKTEEVEITLKLDEYQNIKDGINAYKATLEYDETIFEEVLQSNFTCKNNWEMLKYNKDTKEFVAIKKAGSTTPEVVASITLKVKEEVEPKVTEVKTKDIVTSDGKNDINVDETKVEINIIKEQDTKPEEPDVPVEPDEPTKPEKITSEKYNIEEGYISRIVPKTTVAEFKQNVVLENVTTNPQMVFTDENGNALQESDQIRTGTKLKVGKTLQFILIVIGDIDKTSEIEINDLAQMKLHLIGKEKLTGIELKAADIDGDNEITINDLAQMKLVLINLLEIK